MPPSDVSLGSTKELDAAVAPILKFLEDNQSTISEPTYVFLETAFMWLKRDVELGRLKNEATAGDPKPDSAQNKAV